jgi:hypothetical protein
MNDSEALCAIFNAVLGLAEKMTGEKMMVAVQTESGLFRLSGIGVTWSKVGAEDLTCGAPE